MQFFPVLPQGNPAPAQQSIASDISASLSPGLCVLTLLQPVLHQQTPHMSPLFILSQIYNLPYVTLLKLKIKCFHQMLPIA